MVGSIGTPELIIIFAAVLLVFGPSKIPDLARSLGAAIRDFKKTLTDAEKSPIESTAGRPAADQASQP